MPKRFLRLDQATEQYEKTHNFLVYSCNYIQHEGDAAPTAHQLRCFWFDSFQHTVYFHDSLISLMSGWGSKCVEATWVGKAFVKVYVLLAC